MNKKHWLNFCKDVGEKVFVKVQEYLEKEERKKFVRYGYGGDKTLLLDEIIEKLIIDELKSTKKSFELITEEMGIKTFGEKPEAIIVVDPIDGSNNMKFGLPFVATSIAVGNLSGTMKGIEVGYVKNVINGDSYYSIKGEGAFKNNKKIQVNKERTGCVLVDVVKNRRENFRRLIDFGENFPFVRMLGSGCLGTCFVAEGAVDGYLWLNAKRTIDHAATQLILREAGGIMKTIEGTDFVDMKIAFDYDNSVIVASDLDVYNKIKSVLK
ncbi:MAG: inositol monophosphatase family protein [Candidatus Aenigmarchaeota archaeon]|nr:inositol monophosphatase family protein [Candidatus Aenigmarchaeota archaeon]